MEGGLILSVLLDPYSAEYKEEQEVTLRCKKRFDQKRAVAHHFILCVFLAPPFKDLLRWKSASVGIMVQCLRSTTSGVWSWFFLQGTAWSYGGSLNQIQRKGRFPTLLHYLDHIGHHDCQCQHWTQLYQSGYTYVKNDRFPFKIARSPMLDGRLYSKSATCYHHSQP